MRTLYFDCFAGASGNMILGGLFAIGVDPADLRSRLGTLKVEGFELQLENVDRSGVRAVHVSVKIKPEHKHRHLRDILAILDSSELSDIVRERSAKIFIRLAEAEAEVHGCRVEQVHFHEVGAVDAIVDVVGACVGFELLGVERFIGSRVNVGGGFIQIDHGTYPVPAPAVANLLKGVPAYSNDIEGELLTPTGAAIITALCESYGGFPEMSVEMVGYGAGTRTYEKFPNVLRLIVGDSDQTVVQRGGEHNVNGIDIDRLVLLESNIDDSSPQIIAYASEKLMTAGALDCWVTPIQMKKGRAAHLFSVLCTVDLREQMMEIIFLETSSLGIRCSEVDRYALEREFVSVRTRFGDITVKISRLRGKIVNVMPEFDEVRNAAARSGVPASEVQADAVASYKAGGLAAAGHP